MAQPNASRALSRLERQLGLELVDRSPAGSTLTTEGTVVVNWAREVLDAADQLVAGAAGLRAEKSPHLTVAASMTVAEYLVPRWLGEFRRLYPDVSVNLEVHNSHEVLDRVRAESCQLGLIEAPNLPAGFRAADVGRDHLVVVVSPGHSWARRREPLQPCELAATPLIVRESGSGTRISLENQLHEFGLASPALELNSNAAVRISAIAGVAPAVLSNLAVDAALASGELRRVAVDGIDFERQLRAVWRSSRKMTGPAGQFLEIARRSSD